MMKPSEQTTQQIERFLKKIAQKFPTNEDISLVTDIHIRVSQDSGEMVAFDDDDKEITRCVVQHHCYIQHTCRQPWHIEAL